MPQQALLIVMIAGLLAGGMDAAPRESAAPVKPTAVISAIEPTLYGQRVGLTAFNNHAWTAVNAGFNPDAVALEIIRAGAKRELRLATAAEAGLTPAPARDAPHRADTKALEDRLAALCREWNVETILLLEAATAGDFIEETNQRVNGVGLYQRHIRSYGQCVLRLRTFQRGSGAFVAVKQRAKAQPVPQRAWHDGWDAYSPSEQRAVLRGVEAAMNECVAELLATAGLMDYTAKKRSLADVLNLKLPNQSLWIPDGNELDIPSGVSRAFARQAVLEALSRYRWVLTTDSADVLKAKNGNATREETVTVTINDHQIVLAPTAVKIRPDGEREPVGHTQRWIRNLKAVIVQRLAGAPVETSAPPPAHDGGVGVSTGDVAEPRRRKTPE